MKTVISSTEHVLLFAKNIHRYTASVQIIENNDIKPFSTLKLSDIQNALAQSLGYRHLHELNKSLSPKGPSAWAAYPTETVHRIKRDFAQRLSMLICPEGGYGKGLLRVLIAGALHRDGAKGALIDPADDDVEISMDYTQKPTTKPDKPSIQFSGASGVLIADTMIAIMEAKHEELRLKRIDLEKELLATKMGCLAKAFIQEMSPGGPVTMNEAELWLSHRFDGDAAIDNQFTGEFLAVLNMLIAKPVNTVH